MWRICWFFFLLLAGCRGALNIIEEPDVLKEKGVVLGDEKGDVLNLLGTPYLHSNMRVRGYLVSVLEYDSYQLDYNPGYERDHSNPIHASPGFREWYRRDYRLVFINEQLYSIEDFVHRRFSAISDDLELKAILEDIWQEH